MIPSQRLPASLTPLDVALAALLHRLEPVAPKALPLADALGCVAADMPRLGAFPPRDIAAADGWALRAGDLVGASSYSPLPLARPPVWVEAGDPMPEACDCVVDANFGRSDRPDGSGAGGGGAGAGRSPDRRRHRASRFREHPRAPRSSARSPDRAHSGFGETERPPPAPARRQYSRGHRQRGDGAADCGKCAALPALMLSAPRLQGAMRPRSLGRSIPAGAMCWSRRAAAVSAALTR